jgi:hypothetical protein
LLGAWRYRVGAHNRQLSIIRMADRHDLLEGGIHFITQ